MAKNVAIIEELISAVQNHPAIYDLANPGHQGPE